MYQLDNKSKIFLLLKTLLMLTIAVLLCQSVEKTVYAADQTVYRDGIYCYNITDEAGKAVRLIGMEQTEEVQDLYIPGTAQINGSTYTVTEVDLSFQFYEKEAYSKFYQNVTKLTIADDFTGILNDIIYPFAKVRTVEFKGITVPKKAEFALTNRSIDPDILFIVPAGAEKAYASIIHEVMQYSTSSDLYEHDIEMSPTITSDINSKVENGCFTDDNYIFQVTASAKNGTGKVQLVGLTKAMFSSYLALPEKVTNDGYTYQLTKLCLFSLVYSGAHAIIVPDTVTEMDSAVFDKRVELLFLSRNCKTIPRQMIADENSDSNLRFVYIPEGVTTIADNAFNSFANNKASVILPSTMKTVGKKSLYLFTYVTFLNKKPIDNIKAAIANGTTVKVDSSAIKNYKACVSSKVSVIEAKKVVKATKLTTSDSSLKLKVKDTLKEKAALSKASNETIFWLSTDPSIVTVSDNGTITAKGSGTAYIVAYTRTSGLRKVIKITVSK